MNTNFLKFLQKMLDRSNVTRYNIIDEMLNVSSKYIVNTFNGIKVFHIIHSPMGSPLIYVSGLSTIHCHGWQRN